MAASRVLPVAMKRVLPFQASSAPVRPAASWLGPVVGSAPVFGSATSSARPGPSTRTHCTTCTSDAAASAGQQHQQDFFTITTPLYYVNAGARAVIRAVHSVG